MSLTNIFTQKYKQNHWKSKESVSGTGSELKNTEVLREELQSLFKKYKIKSILDATCGDFNWMKEMDITNIDYIGVDIIPPLIENNKKLYNLDFRVMDITIDPLPQVDLIINRDCLVHLNNENIFKFISNIKKSGSKYLLVTSFIEKKLGEKNSNINILNGSWRPVNLELPPYNFKNPVHIINEKCEEAYPVYTDKSMVLYDIEKTFHQYENR